MSIAGATTWETSSKSAGISSAQPRYGAADCPGLLADAGIVRNRLEVYAAIANLGRILEIQAGFGSFEAWLYRHRPGRLEEWVKLFRATFRFCGGQNCQ